MTSPEDSDESSTQSAQWTEFKRSLLKTIQESSPDGILVVDGQGRITEFNQRFLDIWQLVDDPANPDFFAGHDAPDQPLLTAVLHKIKDPESFLDRVRHLYEHPEERDYTQLELKDGRTIERHSVGMHNDAGIYLGRVWFFRDITRRKRDEAHLQYLAWRDPLTGLLNRRHFFERAEEEIVRARRHQRPLALTMFDVDHFKQVNDRYGHAAGDEALRLLTRRCEEASRSGDLLARIGGEEFALLMPETDLAAAQRVAERLRQVVSGTPMRVEQHAISCTISLGVTPVHHRDEGIEKALTRADIALYSAKHNGRDRVEVRY